MMDRAEQMRERRDREIERSGGRGMPTPFVTKVVGVSFVPAYPDNLYALDQSAFEALAQGEPLTAVLVRNPDNTFDPNAIEVHVPALGDEWGMIGHLTRPIAARMAPEIDAGAQWLAQVDSVLIDPDHLNNPGISITCTRHTEDQ